MNNSTTLQNITPDNNIYVSSTAHSLSTLQAALDYAESGFPVFPCNPGNKSPFTANGFKSASTEPAEIKDWWLKYPDALIGMPTGKTSGFFVLDIDVKHDVSGFDSLAALEKQYGALPTTLTVKTPSGGEHRYFIMPETSQTLSISAGKLGAGLDTRGDGGYVITPPSVNSEGKAYEFVDIDIEPAELPDWIISLLLKPKSYASQAPFLTSSVSDSSPYGHVALKGIVAEMAGTPEGQRNDTLNRLAFRVGALVRKGEIDKFDIRALFTAALSTGLSIEEVRKTMNSGFEAGLQSSDIETDAAVAQPIKHFLEENDWPEPQPLEFKTEALPYPVEALPDTIRAAVKEVQSFVKSPMAMVASSAIGALSLVVQSHVDVKKASNLQGPSGLFLLTIADSGERKSTCDNFFIQTVREYEQSQILEAAPLMLAYETERLSWEAKLSGIKERIKISKRNDRDTSKYESNLQELMTEKPEPPKIPRMLYADSTPEALGYSLAKTWPSGGLISAEAGTVFGSHGMSKDSAMRNFSLLNQLWDGATISIDRRTSDSFTVSGARLTVALQVQEATLKNFFNSTGTLARGTGFMARFLVAWPESTQGTRLFEEPPKEWPCLQEFKNKLTGILKMAPNIDESGMLTPQMIELTAEAKKQWITFHDNIESKLGSGGELADVKDVASKAADNATRLAAIFHVFEHGIGPICEDCFCRAALVVDWHVHESKRFFGDILLPEEQLRMIRLNDWLIRHCSEHNTSYVSTRTAQQRGPIRKKAELEATIKDLQELDRIQIQVDGKQKRIALNPMLLSC